MRKIYLLLSGFCLIIFPLFSQNRIVITGVFDGPLPGGLPKGIELFVLEDIADLSEYGLESANNGGGVSGVEYQLPSVSAVTGDFLYVTAEQAPFNEFFGFNADFVDGGDATNINGDDAVLLYHNSMVVDMFGDPDNDGTGTAWEYLDGWVYRIDDTGPDPQFNISNWNFSGPNVFDGETSNATATIPFPAGSYSNASIQTVVAADDYVQTELNTGIFIPVTENDFFPQDTFDSVYLIDAASNGSVEVLSSGDAWYMPDSNFCGIDTFTYEVCFLGDCDIASVFVTVHCPPVYEQHTIGEITVSDSDGKPVSEGLLAEVNGVVYGVNLRPSGLQFTLIDEYNDGIAVFNFDKNYGYTVSEGDALLVRGEVTHYNGLIQIQPDTLWMLSENNQLVQPTDVTELNEDTESQLIRIENVWLVEDGQWTNSGVGFNVDVTNGQDTFQMRIDDNVDIFGSVAPSVPFNVIGLGGQYDTSTPYFEGYQILPRYLDDIDLLIGTDEINLKGTLSLSPNPATEILRVSHPFLSGKLNIFDINGKLVFSAELDESRHEFRVDGMIPGFYFVTIRDGASTVSKKLHVVH